MEPNKIQHRIFHYTAIFEEDLDMGGYTVTIPALPGCISEGETFEEAEANIKEAAQLYIETMREEGRSMNQREPRVIVAPVDFAF